MKEKKMSDNKSKSNDVDWGLAGFDFAKLIESCQISGVDMMSLIDMEKKNIDALIEVNRSAYDSWRNLMAHQAEVFQETMKAIAAEARDESVAGRRTEIAKQGFEKALANMRQLAETATESQKQTMEIMRRRFEDGMAAMRNQGGSASSSAERSKQGVGQPSSRTK
jgi:phasin family protein